MPRFEITHKILRAEYLTIVIEAESEDEAYDKGLGLCRDCSTADYEPGDVEEDFDDVDVRRVSDDAELTADE